MAIAAGTGRMLGVLLMLLCALPVQAARLETLIMPGEVIQGHAKIETECAKCHARLESTSQNTLCLDCHKDVRKDIESGQGFHGRRSGLAEQPCKSCHTDHKGRGADIVKLNKDAFDHSVTDFRLEAAHARLSCTACHTEGKAFREAPGDCIGCHREDDPHKQRLGEQCADCHSVRAWAKTGFDHAKTDFALKGAHTDVTCSACHPNQRYENTPADCHSCHALNDVHRGRNGTHCADCHSEKRWDETRFDHGRETEFPLRGRHAKVACEACHTEAPAKVKLKIDCIACHRADDSHHGRNGTQCANCHDTQTWSQARFDHARKTDFALRGKHADAACGSCHRGRLEDKLGTACIDCHRADDVHRGKQGEACANCHREQGWGEEILFDHDLTGFPLIGLHATAPCEECHASTTFKQTPKDCVQCHQADDTHQRTLGKNCAGCHNPNGWALWEFDHDAKTDFALEGAHTGLACASCHRDAARGETVRQSKLCGTCHAQDDKHRGRFGRQCERCHDQDSFRNVKLQP